MKDGPGVRPVRRRADPGSGPTRPPPGVEYLGPVEYVSWQAIGSSCGSVPARGARRPRRRAARSRFAATAPCAPKVAAAGAQPTGNASELQSATWIRATLPCALIVLKPRAVPCPRRPLAWRGCRRTTQHRHYTRHCAKRVRAVAVAVWERSAGRARVPDQLVVTRVEPGMLLSSSDAREPTELLPVPMTG